MLSADMTRTEKLHVTMVNFVIPLCLAASSTTVTRKAQSSGECESCVRAFVLGTCNVFVLCFAR